MAASLANCQSRADGADVDMRDPGQTPMVTPGFA